VIGKAKAYRGDAEKRKTKSPESLTSPKSGDAEKEKKLTTD
jgi:hypothetical protein